jgi:putative endonuclease
MIKCYTVYVLYSQADSKFYIGFTSDLKRRLLEHRSKRNHTTSRYKNFELIFREDFISKQDAMRRERYFKTSKGKRTLRLMLKESLKCI